MLAMQDKPALIQEQSVTNSDRRTTINQREEVNLLPTTQIITTKIELLPSQMTKSQAKMVNEASTCSATTVDTINSNTNTMVNSISTLANEPNQVSSMRPQSHHSNNSHLTTAGTNNAPPSLTTATPTITTSTSTTNSARTAKRTANDYRFGKTIGEGSFSSVYIAQDIHTKKEVASKLYSSN